MELVRRGSPERERLLEGVPAQRIPSAVVYRRRVVVPHSPSGSSSSIDIDDEAAVAEHAARRLRDPSAEVRTSSLEALMRDVKVIERHTATVAALLDDDVWFVRNAAVVALSRLPLQAAQAIDYFVPRLADPSEDVRAAAIDPLGRLDASELGDDACAAVRRLLTDVAWPVRKAAVAVVRRLQPQQLGNTLGKLLRDDVAQVRLAAIDALTAIGGADGSGGGKDSNGIRVEGILEQHAEAMEHLTFHDNEPEVRHEAHQLWRAAGYTRQSAGVLFMKAYARAFRAFGIHLSGGSTA